MNIDFQLSEVLGLGNLQGELLIQGHLIGFRDDVRKISPGKAGWIKLNGLPVTRPEIDVSTVVFSLVIRETASTADDHFILSFAQAKQPHTQKAY